MVVAEGLAISTIQGGGYIILLQEQDTYGELFMYSILLNAIAQPSGTIAILFSKPWVQVPPIPCGVCHPQYGFSLTIQNSNTAMCSIILL